MMSLFKIRHIECSLTSDRGPLVRSSRPLTLVTLVTLSLLLSACETAGVATTESAEPDSGRSGGRIIPIRFDGGAVSYVDQSVGVNPCDPNPCPSGALCETDEMIGEMGMMVLSARCVSQTCDELECLPGQRCESRPEGGVCVDEGCVGPEGCDISEYCDRGTCQPDLCQASERVCMDDVVVLCAPDGSGFTPWVSCPQGPSQCVSPAAGDAGCSCLDDWDCPTYQRCDRGVCRGRPEPPTCLLPPEPFDASLPAPEIVWGGTADEVSAVGSPFPESVQVVMTPLVANLTDDNGDGLIDEGDSPEVIFMSFCGSSYNSNGALRAIHGGGPKRGQDLFASLGFQTWYEGQPLDSVAMYRCENGLIDPTAGIAVANLDPPGGGDPEPEIVAIQNGNGIIVYNHRGEVVAIGAQGGPGVGPNPTPSIAQLDGEGMAEVIVSRVVYTIKRDADGLSVLDQFVGRGARGTNGQGGVSCVADIDGDGRPEVIAGGSVYRMPRAPVGAQSQDDCEINGGAIVPADEEEVSWCQAELIDVWDAQEVNAGRSVDYSVSAEGFCAIADVWGADPLAPPSPSNPPDGSPEVVLISNGVLHILEGATGLIIHQERYGANTNDRGGAPNVGDFDGDGFPEIGSAFARGYVMMDLQPPTEACPNWPDYTEDEANNGLAGRAPRAPGGACTVDADCALGGLCRAGQCICAHQGWRRSTEDDSSKVTGSTLFDFNGDGLVEVIYNDECFFRIYDGSTGETLFRQPSESRTRIEHPIVADVDADGNAEIVFSTSTESRFCSRREEMSDQGAPYRDLYNPGIEVWGDPQDRWVPARRIWNQHAYHITNISESGEVPLSEPPGWMVGSDTSYNTYRAQPQAFGIAPDLVIDEVRATSSASCSSSAEGGLNVSVTIYNRGEVQVGAGLEVVFSALSASTGERRALLKPNGDPLIALTPAPLPPGSGVTLSLNYDAAQDPSASGPLSAQDELIATVDSGGMTGFGQERECNEGNNELSVNPSDVETSPDLTVSILDATPGYCPEVTLTLGVQNLGQGRVSNYEVGLYLGDATQGGTRIDTLRVEDPLEAGASTEITWVSERFPIFRTVQLSVAIDPLNLIPECDDANNYDQVEAPLSCEVLDGK